MKRVLLMVTLSIVVLMLSGCAQKIIYTDDELESIISERLGVNREQAQTLIPFAVNPEILKIARKVNLESQSDRAKIQAILATIISENSLNVVYEKGASLSAYQVLVQRSANCVAFTNLFVALARAAGLDAVFVDVTERVIYEADEFYNYQTGHICAGIRDANGIQLVDFVYYTKQYKRYRVIDDLEAIANYLTLLGVRNDKEFIKTGNPEYQKRSINFHTSALILSPNFTRALNNLAVIYLRQGNYRIAEELLRRAIRLDDKMVTARYNLAELYIRTGKTQKAMDLLIENLNEYSNEPNSHYRLGQIYFSLGENDLAEYHLRRAIEIKEDFMAPRLVLLSLLISNNQLDEAEKLLADTEKRFPSNEKVLAYREMLKKNDLDLLQY